MIFRTSLPPSFWQRAADVYRRFKSPKTTAGIILILLSLFLLGMFIPQEDNFATAAAYVAWQARHPGVFRWLDYFGLTRIYVAPITIFFLSLFFLNLIVVMSHRVPLVLERCYLVPAKYPSIDLAVLRRRPAATMIASMTDTATTSTTVRAYLRKHFWFLVDRPGSSVFLAVKNRFSPLGFLLFHASFLLCLVSGLFVAYTRFSGELILTEGQEFNADIRQFRRIDRQPIILKELPPVGIKLERVVPKYDRNVASDLEVTMKVKYWNDIDNAVVGINRPVRKGPVTILAQDVGVSPLFTLRTTAGKEIDGAYVSLNVMGGAEDSFRFNTTPYVFFVKFYPDYLLVNGKDTSRSKELNNPVVRMRVLKDGVKVGDGLLHLGQAMYFGNLVLSFPDIRYWVDFHVIREYGYDLLIFGFAFGVIGLLMRLVFYQKTLTIAIESAGEQCVVWVDGRSEYYKYSFAEDFAVLVGDVKILLERDAESGQRKEAT